MSLPPLPNDQDASGRSFDESEVQMVAEALRSGTLTCTKGSMVRKFQDEFAQMIGVKHAHACTSGSAAMHVAVAAINPEPGEEIITTPVTDMGALSAIVYQGAIPVFADVDPRTYNVTAETIQARLSDRTRAIVVTHLFGNPCEMDKIMDLANRHKLPVIEDAAQAFLARFQGKPAGTLGTIACFSLQQGKHITTGEGGIVVTSDDALARRAYLFINKAWGYGDPKPDHYFLAPNYRMSELDGAVALAQLRKLQKLVDHRVAMATELGRRLSKVPGIGTPPIREGDTHVFWRYPIRVDENVIPGGVMALAAALKDLGIPSAPRYIVKPAFECQVFRDQNTFGNSHWPFSIARKEAVTYNKADFPGTYDGLAHVLVLPFNERFGPAEIDRIAQAVSTAVEQLTRQGVPA